jgi:hypothetical protein
MHQLHNCSVLSCKPVIALADAMCIGLVQFAAPGEGATSTTALLGRNAAGEGGGSAGDKLRRRYGGGDVATAQAPQPAQKAITVPIRVEPKVLFANERTFLNWMHTSTIIATIGMALLNLSPNSGAKASKMAGYVGWLHFTICTALLRWLGAPRIDYGMSV